MIPRTNFIHGHTANVTLQAWLRHHNIGLEISHLDRSTLTPPSEFLYLTTTVDRLGYLAYREPPLGSLTVILGNTMGQIENNHEHIGTESQPCVNKKMSSGPRGGYKTNVTVPFCRPLTRSSLSGAQMTSKYYSRRTPCWLHGRCQEIKKGLIN